METQSIQATEVVEVHGVYAHLHPLGSDALVQEDEQDSNTKAADIIDVGSRFGFEKIPIAVNGLALGVSSLGMVWHVAGTHFALHKSVLDPITATCADVALALISMYIAKMILVPGVLQNETFAPNMIPALCPGFMALMVCGHMLLPYYEVFSQVLWHIGCIGVNIGMLTFIIWNLQYKPESPMEFLKSLKPEMIIPLVGIGISAFTGKGMLMPVMILQMGFWVAFVNATLMLPAHFIRALLIEEKNIKNIPTYFILMAPQAVLLTAWLSLNPNGNSWLLNFLVWSTFVVYVCVLGGWGLRILEIPFHFSFVATTFPIVAVSGSFWKCYENKEWPWLMVVAKMQIALASLVVGYVFVRCAMMFIRSLRR